MEVTQDNATPTEQGAAQPDATGTPPAKSEAETKLEGQLADAKAKSDGYKKERDTARTSLTKVSKERDDYKAKYEHADEARQQAEAQRDQLLDEATKPSTTATTEEQPETAGEADEHAETKDILRRNGLKQAWVLPTGKVSFDKEHTLRTVGAAAFDSLTVISAE